MAFVALVVAGPGETWESAGQACTVTIQQAGAMGSWFFPPFK